MGLDTTHDCWHGAYSSFSRWRNMLAVAAGYELTRESHTDDYGSFDYVSPRVTVDPTWEMENYEGVWKRLPEDPLLILLVHSDCEGHIEAEHAFWLAGRLEQLLPQIAQLGLEQDDSYVSNGVERTMQFIDGLRKAHAAGERIEFW